MDYSILVNTCDRFEDCWQPFFKLWSIYWKDCTGRIYLNTEYKDYSYPGINIIPVKGCAAHHIPRNQRISWSICLRWALESINTDIVLYMQEDYFLTNKVDNEKVEYYVSLMENNPDITCIQLTSEGIPATNKSSIDQLYHSDNNYFSYVSCQASLWRKDVLLKLIRDYETAWNFEWWGSKRAKYMGLDFLTVDKNIVKKDGYQIIPYVFTGVIGGKWNKDVVKLFEEHGITMDYTHRGFHSNQKPTLKKRIKTKRDMLKIRSLLEIWFLKYAQKNKSMI
ncbi:hypothetical protein [Phocaeicola salanitronis]|uniref:hypothetical protein n=1 Tax=Phocaeicola salanitronis TaxID=376805 RepID=UPI0023F67E2A|nr:hypothetical protein [Phocaeicola salanitronis]